MVVSERVRVANLLTEAEAALLLGVHVEAVRSWCDEGILSASVGGGAGRLITEDSVLALIPPLPR